MRHTLVSVASSLLLLPLTQGRSLPRLIPRGDAGVPGYNYQGCYTEATSGRALSGSSFFNDLMTVEKCAASCSAFPLFGVEYGRECFCGQSLNAGSVLAAETDCSFKCPGNSAETCGAGNRLNVYQKPVAPPDPKPTSYASEGCYTEPSNGRALTGKTIFDDSLTIEKCAMLCADFNYFGVEYYRECYCGNDLQTGSVPAPSTDCKYPCKGDNSEICGGDYRLNLYGFGGMSPSSTTTASATATPSPSNYVSRACYTEAKNSRALTGATYVDDKMTTELCAAACTGFDYFGTEYARECYCGNMLQDGSRHQLIDIDNIHVVFFRLQLGDIFNKHDRCRDHLFSHGSADNFNEHDFDNGSPKHIFHSGDNFDEFDFNRPC
ncbi:MAG: hypothetical protein L6R37_006115 [Teloschistes peruensis]|nr:MAG: hypothetical protein L6R37_006115 [Teloschistes peruensis]